MCADAASSGVMSIPASMPLRPSAYSRPSVAMLPVALGANGQAALFDLQAKYAEVVDEGDVLAWLGADG